MVAEFGAAFLRGQVGIVPRTAEKQSAYIDGWLRVLMGKRLLPIAAQAQKAADFILGNPGRGAPSRDEHGPPGAHSWRPGRASAIRVVRSATPKYGVAERSVCSVLTRLLRLAAAVRSRYSVRSKNGGCPPRTPRYRRCSRWSCQLLYVPPRLAGALLVQAPIRRPHKREGSPERSLTAL